MITKHALKMTLGLIAFAGALIGAPAGNAQSVTYQVNLNTAALIGNLAGPFSLDFQLTDGSGSNDGNNTATLSNFTFGGGGSPFGSANLIGNTSGSLATGVTLTDSAFFNEFYQSFTPGSTLSFSLTLTTSVDSGLTPDALSFAILDGSLANIPTTIGGDSLIFINIDRANPLVQIGSATGSFTGVTVTSVPEPSVCVIALLGFAGLLGRSRKAACKI